jgi:cyclophilin family peptidyl-prolyl cis-trans isomerase
MIATCCHSQAANPCGKLFLLYSSTHRSIFHFPSRLAKDWIRNMRPNKTSPAHLLQTLLPVRFREYLLAMSVVVALAVNGTSQEVTSTTTPAATSTPQAAEAQFNAKFAEYKQILHDIEEQRTAYQQADEAVREQINSNLGKQIDQAQKTVEEMINSGMEAFREAPNQNEQITDLLTSVAQHYAVGRSLDKEGKFRSGGDHYEKALPIIEVLVKGDAKDPGLPVWGFVSAFNTNQYDLAADYLAQAQENQGLVNPETITEPAQKDFMATAWKYATLLDSYREMWAEEQAIRDAEATADDLPRVKLQTNKGDVVVELFENESPIAVANFITLVKKGFYDDLSFHRVLPMFMAQGGCPLGTGTGGPGYNIACECYEPNARHHFRGSLSMAHAGQNTGGSQFFLTFVPTNHLDGKHTVFGRVVEGFDVLGDLQRRSPSGRPQNDQNLPPADKILKAEVLRDRGHPYDYPKLPSN